MISEKCYRGKRMVQMSMNKNTPDPDPCISSSNTISSFDIQATKNSFNNDEPKTFSTNSSIDPNSNIIVLTTSTYSDCEIIQYSEDTQIDISDCEIIQYSEDTQIDISSLTVVVETSQDTVGNYIVTGQESTEIVPITSANIELSTNSVFPTSPVNDNFSLVHLESATGIPSTSDEIESLTFNFTEEKDDVVHHSDSCSSTVSNISLDNLNQNNANETNEAQLLNNIQDTEVNDICLVPYSSSSDSDTELPIKSKIRNKKHNVDRKKWFAVKNRQLRETGSKYYGRVKKNSKWAYENEKEPRQLKERCKCKGSKLIKCDKMQEKMRQETFNKFWKNLTWGEKKIYIDEHVISVPVKRERDRKNAEESRRTQSLVYYLPGEPGTPKLRVCQTMFLNTLNIGRMTVLGWKNKLKDGSKPSEQRAVSQNIPCFNERQSSVAEFFDALPKMESHYCRASTSRIYLLAEWQYKKDLYNFYVSDWCASRHLQPLSTTSFFKTMEDKKISLYRPKKDGCEKCALFKEGSLEENEYRLHMNRKEEAREEKIKDKDDPSCIVFAADVQAVLLCPVSKISTLYYKTKLQVHNLCFKNLKTTDAFSFIWNESEGGVNAEEFASIWVNFFETKVVHLLSSDCNRIVIYTDGCGYQNRNCVMSNALLNFAIKHNVFLEQKYLEVGHTEMEVDSMHATIERNLKNKIVNVPADYINIIKTARKEPYYVEYLSHDYFKNFDSIQAYKSIRPGRSVGDAKVNDIRAIQYCPSGEILYKISLTDNWTILPQRRTLVTNVYFDELPRLHESRLPIKERKYQDLQQIKLILPVDYREFYDNLPH